MSDVANTRRLDGLCRRLRGIVNIRAVLACYAVASSLVAAPAWAQTTSHEGAKPQTRKARRTAKEQERERAKEKNNPTEPTPDGRTTGTRPYRALFGGASSEPELRESLDLTISASEVFDDNLLIDLTGPEVSQTLQQSGFYTTLLSDLAFRRRGERLQLAASGGVSTRYYSTVRRFVANDYHTAFGFSAQTSRRATLTVNQAFSRSPVYLLGLFASAVPPSIGDVIAPATDFAANDDRSYSSDTSAAYVQNFTRRAALSMATSLRRTNYLVTSARGEAFSAVDAGGTYTYGLKPDLGLRLGYIYRQANYVGALIGPGTGQPPEHDLDIGVDIRRALSRTRRTAFTFKGGTALVSSGIASDFSRPRRQLRVLADGSLTHQMGETWSLNGSYQRGTGLVEGLAAPVFSDAFTVASNGFVGPRADLAFSVGYSKGSPASVGTQADFTTYTGTAKLRYGLTRSVALTTEYLYYFYDFSSLGQLAPGLVPRVRRNSIRAGVSFWTPLKRR
jgi:hypothetical protein